MIKKDTQLIVALDVDTLDEAKKLITQLESDVNIFKVGSQLFTICGPVIVQHLLKTGKRVFLDLKFHDIPNTVANAVRAATRLSDGDQSVFMCTLHTAGGQEMLERAVSEGWPLLVPTGCIEYHGPHMALGLDTIVG